MEPKSNSNFGLVSTKSYSLIKISETKVKSSCFSLERGFFIEDSQKLMQVDLFTLNRTLLETNVVQVSCNETVTAFITTSGSIFTFGEDKENFGTLGIKNCFSIKYPSRISLDFQVSQVHLGPSHVACLSKTGELFTWGSGVYGELGVSLFSERQLPTLVRSAQIFLIKQVVCGKGFTAICTAGGFLYIYGQLPVSKCGVKKLKSPYTIKDLSKTFITEVSACLNFVAVMTDQKEVFLTDACLELYKLPEKYSKIACSEDSLVAVSKKHKLFHELKPALNATCKASNLNEKVFLIEELISAKVNFFSGALVGYQLDSVTSNTEMRLQYLSQNKLRHNSQFLKEFNTKQPILANLVSILVCKLHHNLKASFGCLRFNQKYQNMREKNTLSLVLMSILNNLSIKFLIHKKNSWKKFWSFSEQVKRRRKSKEFKKSFTIQKVLQERLRKVLLLVVFVFNRTESLKVAKIRLTEKIVSKMLSKTSKDLTAAFSTMKKFSAFLKKAGFGLAKVFDLIDKQIKATFIQSLVQVNVIKARLRKIINQILAYSAAKSSRTQIFKHFHEWKRQIISSKIAAISQKYSRSIKTKKITEKVKQLLRKSLKIGLFSLKLLIRTPFNKLKLSFFLKTFNLFFYAPKKESFLKIKAFSKVNRRMINLMKSLLKTRFKNLQASLQAFIKAKRLVLLMKILSNRQTRLSNLDYKKKFEAFNIPEWKERRSFSPALSFFSDSGGSVKIFNPTKSLDPKIVSDSGQKTCSPFGKTDKIMPVKPIDFSKLKNGNQLTLETFLNKFGSKAKSSHKAATIKTPNFKRKTKKKALTLSSREYSNNRSNKSENNSFLIEKPGPDIRNLKQPDKEYSIWERQLMGLAQSLLFNVYKNHYQMILNRILKEMSRKIN